MWVSIREVSPFQGWNQNEYVSQLEKCHHFKVETKMSMCLN